MFIEINERLVNIINIQAIKEDEAALKILYRLSNGDYLEETFSSKADFDNKVKDIENAGGGGIKDLIIILPELPEEGEPNKIYLIPKQDTQTSDLYDEYIWINEGTEDEPDWKWEWITTKQVDLSPYYTKDETAENFLKKDNTVAFTPSGDYNPATKKYVDEKSIPYQPFPSGITTNDTTQTMISSIRALNLPAGSTYLGGVTLTDMPFNGNAEVEIYVYPNNVIYLTLRSSNVSPYLWECNSHSYRGWEPVGKAYADTNFLKKDNATSYTPSTNYNPATKKYVDDSISTTASNYIAKNNNVQYTPTNDYNPTTKKYVDDSISTAASNYIAKNNTTSYTPSGDYNPATKKYVDDAVTSLASDLASEYDSTKTYNVGDYVLYEGSLYKCNTDIDVAEVWTPAHWDTATISDIMHNAQDIMQYEVLPNITPENLGKIVQYTGATTIYHTNGYFYKASSRVVDGETIYVWNGLLVQPVPDISVKEDVSNKVNTLDPNSTTKYPSTKAVYDHVNTVFNSDLWHYKGHVNSTSNLPSTGQHSVTPEDPNIVIPSALKATGINEESWRNKISNVATEQLPNYLGAAWVNGGNLYSVAITTNDISVIKGITYVTDATERWLAGIRLEPNGTDTTKILFSAYSVHYFVTDTGGTIQIKNNTPFEVSQSGWVFLCRINKNATSFANSGAIALYSNLSYLKFIPYNLDTAYYSGNPYTVSKHVKTITNNEDYTYAQDFKLYLFDSTTGYCSYAGDEASPYVHENDVYTVGANNDIYRCNNIPEWELLSAVDLSDYLPKDNTSSYTPTNDYNPATKKYVDDSIPTVPTSTSALTNDSGFITNSVSDLTNYLNLANTTTFVPTGDYNPATKKYVDDAIAATGTMKKEIVPQLPTTGIDANTIYMVPASSASTNNYYDEYMYINNQWEKIGSTEVDLSNYLAKNNTTTFTPSGDYNPSTKKYVDDLFKSDLLHYKGHVATAGDLPSSGQHSAPITGITFYMNVPLRQVISAGTGASLSNFTTWLDSNLSTYLGIYNSNKSINTAITTDYPECIDGISFTRSTAGNSMVCSIHVLYDVNKPVYVKTSGNDVRLTKDSSGSFGAPISANTLTQITEDMWVPLSGHGWSSTTDPQQDFLFGNISRIRYKKFTARDIYWQGNSSTNSAEDTIVNANEYAYADTWEIFKFNEGLSSWISDSDYATLSDNDVYTVGANNDIYRYTSVSSWELWSAADLTNYYNKTEVDTKVNTVLSNIAPTYDNTQTYDEGDYVIYNSQLYVCNTDIQTAEDFDSSHWDSTTIAEILGNIKSLLGGI